MKKICTVIMALIAMTSVWAQNNVITYTATEKLVETTTITAAGLHTNAFNVPIISHTFHDSIGIITFEGDVTKIGEFAFAKTNSLLTIQIPNSVTSIGKCAFTYCQYLTTCMLPDAIDTIQRSTFYYCVRLSKTNIPANTVSIEHGAFWDCRELKELPLNNKVQVIGDYAFNSSGLTSIKFPATATSISSTAISRCVDLTSIVVDPANPVYDSRENCNALIKTATNTLIDGCQTTIIPNTVTSIAADAFAYCYTLKSIVIPNSVTSIGARAFIHCGVTSIVLSDSLKYLGTDVFYWCDSLKSIRLPMSIMSMSTTALKGCSNVTNITVDPRNKTYDSRDSCNAIIHTATNTIKLGCNNTVIPNTVTALGEKSFTYTVSMKIPTSVTKIGQYAFSNLLKTLYMESSIPPTCPKNSVGSPTDVHICVPVGSLAAYQAADGWKDYVYIQEGKITYQLNWDVNGGDSLQGDYTSGAMEIGAKIVAPERPSKKGWIFNGWSPSVDSVMPMKDVTYYAQWSKPDYVDLGLSVYWSTINLGAYEREDEYGYFYAWGDARNKEVYSRETYQSNTTDVVTANWGGAWRTPTKEEWEELLNNCTIERDSANWSVGYRITSKVKGYTNQSIYLPTSGYRANSDYLGYGAAYYWTNTSANDTLAHSVLMHGDTIEMGTWEQFMGLPIRPVLPLDSMPKPIIKENGALPGVFSVSDSTAIRFSQGNLQYNATKGTHTCADGNVLSGTWRFAINQFDVQKYANSYRSMENTEWIDMFSYGASGYNGIMPYQDTDDTLILSQMKNIHGSYYDFGVYNAISNGGNTPNQWRMFTQKEWAYLINERPNALKLLASAVVNGERGLIIWPDYYQHVNKEYSFVSAEQYPTSSDNIYDAIQWKMLESDGAVFLPLGISVYSCGEGQYCVSELTNNGDYGWYMATYELSSPYYLYQAVGFSYDWNIVSTIAYLGKGTSFLSVRLVQDAIKIKPKYSIIVAPNNSLFGSVEGAGKYIKDTTIILTANPIYGYRFTQWNDGNTDNPRQLVVTQDSSFVASFEIDYSVRCGDHLYWNYNDGKLTITGEGTMYDFEENKAPWAQLRDSIYTIVLSPDETTIGNYAFGGCTLVKEIIIGFKMEKVGIYAFAGCKKLTNVSCFAPQPPLAEISSFATYKATLVVVCESQTAYEDDDVFGSFKTIKCDGATEIEDPITEPTVIPSDTTAVITWPKDPNAATYEIVIKKNGVVFCILTFNKNGFLIGIAFAPSRGTTNATTAAEDVNGGYQFTITSLDPSTTYNYDVTSKREDASTINSYKGEFTTTGKGITTTLNDVQSLQLNVQKVMINGQLYILRDGKMYNAIGQEL